MSRGLAVTSELEALHGELEGLALEMPLQEAQTRS